MYARRQTRPKPRQAQSKKFDAPVAGWISNQSLSSPSSFEGQGAAVLDNFFPKSSSVVLRRGKVRYATLGDETKPTLSLFAYVNGLNKRLFGATDDRVYDITNVAFPRAVELADEDEVFLATEDGDIFGWGSDWIEMFGSYTGGYWSTAQFATTGGVYLIGVNGSDEGFIFDGAEFYPNVAGGIFGLSYDAEVTPFTEGDTLTGGTSGATGTIVRAIDNGATGVIWLRDVTGTFEDNETITDESGGSGTTNGVGSVLAPGITFGGGLTSADMSYVWVYKSRLWFAQKDSMTAWYMDNADSIGGTAEPFPLGGVFGLGGSLLFGSAWSIDSSSDSGLSEQNIFVSTEGEVAVYQGSDPGEAATWSKVGVYRIGKPLGARAHFRGGGDIAIATSVGLVPLSKAISLDVTSLNVATVSYKIADAWSEAVTSRGMDEWQCAVWPEQKMAVISPPNLIGADYPVMFISNTETGSWARFTNWYALCMTVFDGRLFFGSPSGAIYIANASGLDEGETYTGTVLPLFEDLGSLPAVKIGKMGRAMVRANGAISGRVAMHVDYDMTMPSPPDASGIAGDNVWDSGKWGSSSWGDVTPSSITQQWESLSGLGYTCSISFQVTSGTSAPIDAELISLEMLTTTAEAVT